MKKFLPISILFLLFSLSIIAQSPCPTITVNAPSQQIKIGGSMTFTAQVEGINTENLKYKWVVSNGEIISGQGTLAIVVATKDDMAGQTINATIEVSGLLQSCQNSFSGSGEIKEKIIVCPPITLDFYQGHLWQDEKPRLDLVAQELKKDKEFFVLFQLNIRGKKHSQIFRARKARIERYLTQRHKISKDRIRVVMGGTDEISTKIMLIPVGVKIPF